MATQLHTATAQGAIEYLDSLVTKKRATAQVVSPLKTALTKVLQRTKGEGWGQTVLADLDVGDTMMRFKNLTWDEKTYTLGSYRNYEMRLKKAIEWYLKFLETPGWTPPESARAAAPRKKMYISYENSPSVTQAALEKYPAINPAALHVPYPASLSAAASGQARQAQGNMGGDTVTYPFPLESGNMASLQIPRDITAGDVQRMHNFIDALLVRKEGEDNP